MYTNILVVTVRMSAEKTSELRIGLIDRAKRKRGKKQEKEEAVNQVRAISQFGLFL